MAGLLQTLLNKRGFGYGLFSGLFGAALLLLMARGVIVHVPLYDELLHFLAAQGLRETGEPAIADGLYSRATLFTHLVALSFSMFGDTLVAARVPALASAMALLVVLAAWVTRRQGLLVGIAAAICLCLVPTTIELAVFARFYTLHALCIFVMAIALYEAMLPARGRSSRIWLLVLALGLAPLALHFQDSTVVAAGALACGVAAVAIFDHWAWVRQRLCRYPLQIAIGAVLLLGAGWVLIAKVGLLEKMEQVPLWNAWAVGRPHYYLMTLARELPLLWPLFPVALVLALLVHPRFAIFSAVVLLSGLAVHSIAGSKSMRYIYYLLPFFCVIWGCAISAIAAMTRNAWQRAPKLASSYAEFAVLGLMALVIANSIEGQGAAKLLAGRATPAESLGLSNRGEPEWSPIMPTLAVALANADRIVTSNAMKSLYYFGRYDYELNVSIVAETDTEADFGVDPRTGKQAIGAAESIKQVILMPGTTLIVLEDEKMNLDVGVPSESMEVIEALCAPISFPTGADVHAWSCPRPQA